MGFMVGEGLNDSPFLYRNLEMMGVFELSFFLFAMNWLSNEDSYEFFGKKDEFFD